MSNQDGPERSAVKNLAKEVRRLQYEIRNMKAVREIAVCGAEFNTVARDQDKTISTDGPIPVARLLVLAGRPNGIAVMVLKDDGCNTNVVSSEFVKKHRDVFEIPRVKTAVSHYEKGSTKIASETVIDGTQKLDRISIDQIG